MILILAVVYWSFFCLIRDYNWFSFNKQLGTIYTLTYRIRYSLDRGLVFLLAASRFLYVPFFYYKALLYYNSL